MATAPNELGTITTDSAARPSIWRRIADRPYAPETLLLYSALSFFFLGRNLIGHFSDRYIGVGPDPTTYMLYFEWWRYAIANHLNPFTLTGVWYPNGFNLTWTPSAPLACWAVLPLEVTFGPIAVYNLAVLLCPAVSAWSAFLLCRYITPSYWPSMAGGYIFGFSSYMLAQSLAHVDLTMAFLLPPIAYLALQWTSHELTDVRFVGLLALALLGQFLSSSEVLAAMTMVATMFLILSWLWAGDVLRARILELIPRIAASFAILVVLTSPYLYYFFRRGPFSIPAASAQAISAHPAELFLPVSTNIFGGWTAGSQIVTGVFLWEAGEYVGIPLFLVLLNFARTHWNEPAAKTLTVFCAFVCVATFGPYLMVGNKPLIPLPWLVITHLPLLHMILPARLSVYIVLDLAIVAAMWLASPKSSYKLRIGAAATIIVSLLPNLSASYWTSAANTPAFFRGSVFRKYLSRDETVLVLPYGYLGDSDLWLAQTRMYFKMAGGYVSPTIPPSFAQYPIVPSFYNLVDIPDADEQLKCFLVQKHVDAVIVADEGESLYRPISYEPVFSLERVSFSPQEKRTIEALFAGLNVAPIHVGGVSLYRVPLEKLQTYARIRPEALQKRIAALRFATLIIAAKQYLAQGYDPKLLTPLKAQELGLLPPRWVGGMYELPQYRRHVIQDELLLGSDAGSKVGIGVFGQRSALAELAQNYSPFAATPSSVPTGAVRAGNGLLIQAGLYSPSAVDSTQWLLLLEFQRHGLTQAAEAAERVLAEQAAHHI